MKGMAAIFLGTIATIPLVPCIGQINAMDTASTLGTSSVQVVLAFVAVVEGLILFQMFKLWRTDVDQARREAKEVAELLRQVVGENSVAMTELNTSTREMRESVYHLSSVISNCEEVRKVAHKRENKSPA